MQRKVLFIASEVRSGSTYFAESLTYELNQNLGFAMWPLAEERFSHLGESSTPEDILETWKGLYLDRNGFAASKIMCKALSVIQRSARESDDVRQAFFGENTYWIVVRRRDRIKQAVSLAMSIKSGVYHHYGDEEDSPDKGLIVTNAEIELALRMISLSDIYLDAFSSTLAESRLVSCFYEDFMADEVSWLNRVHAMCGFPPIERGSYVNQAKLKPTAEGTKRTTYEKYRQWFLTNYV